MEATCIDASINLRGESPERSENFLMEMLTGEANHTKNITTTSAFKVILCIPACWKQWINCALTVTVWVWLKTVWKKWNLIAA